jgi:hypothetical protein
MGNIAGAPSLWRTMSQSFAFLIIGGRFESTAYRAERELLGPLSAIGEQKAMQRLLILALVALTTLTGSAWADVFHVGDSERLGMYHRRFFLPNRQQWCQRGQRLHCRRYL